MKLLAPRPSGSRTGIRLFIPSAEMEFTRFDRVRRWEEIAVALLKKYIDRYYKHRKQEWEADHLEYHELREDDPNFVQEYRLLIDQSADAHQDQAGRPEGANRQEDVQEGLEFGNLSAYWFGNHLYQPLLHLSKSQLIEVSPVSLNDGERDFVLDLQKFHDGEQGLLQGPGAFPPPQREQAGHRLLRGGQFLPGLHPLAPGRQEAIRHFR